MTKTKLFLSTILLILGGFILSAPSSAFATGKEKDPNEGVVAILNQFKKQKLILNADETKEKISDRVKPFKDKLDKAKDEFKAEADKLTQGCQKTYTEAIKDRWNKAKEDYKDAWDDLKKGEILSALTNSIAAQYQLARTAWNVTGINLGIDWLESKGKDYLVETIVDSLWKNGYSFVYQAESVRDFCHSMGKDLTEAEFENLTKKAEVAEAAQAELKGLTGIGSDDKEIWLYKHCTNPKDESTCTTLEFIIDETENTVTSVSGVSQGCTPLPFKLYETKSCLFCPLFKTIFSAVQTASTKSYNDIGDPLAKLLLVGWAIWIAFKVLESVSSMTKQDALEFITRISKQSFKILVIFWMLKNSTIVYGVIIGPLLKAGFEFGTSFVNTGRGTLGSCNEAMSNLKMESGVLPEYVYQNLLCFIKAVQIELATSQAIGSSLMCIAFHKSMSNLGALANAMPDFSMALQGSLIYIISWILSLAFGFYLIDATVSLGIFGVLLPFLLLCWPFELTSSYFKTGFNVFMNSWFVYVFMGIVVNLSMELIGQGLTGGKGGFEAIENAINGNEIKTLQSLLDIGFSGFLILVACCVFGIKLMMKVEDLAGQFSGGLSLGIGKNIGGLAASGATGLAKTGVGAVTGTVSSVANAKVWQGADGKYHSISDGIRSMRTSAARSIAGGIQGGAEGLGHAIASPFKAMARALSGSGRRTPKP